MLRAKLASHKGLISTEDWNERCGVLLRGVQSGTARGRIDERRNAVMTSGCSGGGERSGWTCTATFRQCATFRNISRSPGFKKGCSSSYLSRCPSEKSDVCL